MFDTQISQKQPKTPDSDQFAVAATPNGAIIFHPTKGQYTISKSSPRWDTVRRLLSQGLFQKAVDAIDSYRALAKHVPSLGNIFSIHPITGLITAKGDRQVPKEIGDKVAELVAGGHPVEPLNKFFNKLAQAPAQHVWNEALLFITANNMSLFEDGDVLGYKKVRNDFRDMHSGRFDNSPGAVVSMPRHEVNDDRRISCSSGLHVAAFDYAAGFGNGRLMVVKVHPKDIVSVPYDYNDQKMRTCGYTVVAEMKDQSAPLVNETQIFSLGELAF